MTPPPAAPRFSVVIPTYQRAGIVPEAIDGALADGGADVEVVVVDDGSTDGTAEALAARYGADPRVRVIRKGNGGTASARNAGIDVARGAYIALLDSDDLFLPGHLAALAGPLDADPTVDLAIGDAAYEGGWSRDGKSIFGRRGYRPPLDLEDMCQGLWALPSATMWRASRLQALRFDETFRWAEDTELLFRFFAGGGRAAAVRRAVTRYRFHGGGGAPNKQSSADRIQRARLALQERYAGRARRAGAHAVRLHRRWVRQCRKTGDVAAATPHAVAWWRARPWSPLPWVALWKVARRAAALRRGSAVASPASAEG